MNINKLTANVVLSPSEHQVLEYILNNLHTAMKIGIRGVADNNFTSTSTVMRLAKKLNYTGFIEMLYDLKVKIETKSETLETKSVQESFYQLAELIAKHEIFVYGQGFSEIIAEYFYKKLLAIGRKCWFIQTLEFETVLKNFNGKMGGIIIISKSGQTSHMVDVAQKAKKSHTTVIAFTGNPQSEIACLADVLFHIEDDCPFDDENACPNQFFAKVILAFEQVLQIYYANYHLK